MVSKDVSLSITVDTTQSDAELSRLNAETDKLTDKMRLTRQESINLQQEVTRGIMYLQQALRMTLDVLGITLDPVQNAMLSMISTSVSTMTTVSAGLMSTAVLAPVGIALALLAFEIQALQTAKVLGLFDQMREDIRRAKAEANRTGIRSIRGGPF